MCGIVDPFISVGSVPNAKKQGTRVQTVFRYGSHRTSPVTVSLQNNLCTFLHLWVIV